MRWLSELSFEWKSGRRGEKSVAVGKRERDRETETEREREPVILVQALPMRFSRWWLEFSARRSHVAIVGERRVGAR